MNIDFKWQPVKGKEQREKHKHEQMEHRTFEMKIKIKQIPW